MNVIWYYQQHKASKTNWYGTFPKIYNFFFTFEFGNFCNAFSIWFASCRSDFQKLKWFEHVIAFSGLTNYTQLLPRPAMKESNVTKQRYYWQIYVYTVDAVTSSGILKAKQKIGVTFNFVKQDVIDLTKISKMTMCRASEANSEK